MTHMKPGSKPIVRAIDIVTDHRDKPRPQDRQVVTITAYGVTFKPFKCGEDKAVTVDWGTILRRAQLAEGGKK